MRDVLGPGLCVLFVLVVGPAHRDVHQPPLPFLGVARQHLVASALARQDDGYVGNRVRLLRIERDASFLLAPHGLVVVALGLLLGNLLLVVRRVLLRSLASEFVGPRNLVQVLQLAQLLVDGAADGAVAGWELDHGQGRPVVFAQLGGLRLLAVEWELLQTVSSRRGPQALGIPSWDVALARCGRVARMFLGSLAIGQTESPVPHSWSAVVAWAARRYDEHENRWLQTRPGARPRDLEGTDQPKSMAKSGDDKMSLSNQVARSPPTAVELQATSRSLSKLRAVSRSSEQLLAQASVVNIDRMIPLCLV
ncbi:hypothetical protein TOPH_03225 [Tolypocladium ophioglossoides CBS 100239]|uniref:Secreted protein n=1 Tax=Tolypocladium ophioglossoides (strain CBS 100239) TaxID=1163406 RepID=A0A0L0NDX3_TOLOC|nr:hypothetical protein TOPH_03225 [Tolypocladium ophioglossoides CBS 100239]